MLASSPLPWTGQNAFRLIGYSLGGGIAIPFANAFPNMVSSLVLLAPAGLIRAESFGRVTRFVFSSGFIPERILSVLTGRRLQKPIAPSKLARQQAAAVVAAATEAKDLNSPFVGEEKGSGLTLEDRVLDYVRWMVLNHDGFVPAFMSCIRFAPLTGQHHQWGKLAKRAPGTTAVILAETDELINPRDYTTDGLPLAGGEDNIVWKIVPGSHDFVMTHIDGIMKELDVFWGMKKQ